MPDTPEIIEVDRDKLSSHVRDQELTVDTEASDKGSDTPEND